MNDVSVLAEGPVESKSRGNRTLGWWWRSSGLFIVAYYVPNCAEGYSLQSWSGGAHACPVFACDPEFSL